MNFFSYAALVFQWAAKGWAAWVWENLLWAAVLGAVPVIVGIWLRPSLLARWPSLRPYLGDDTMANVVQVLILAAMAALLLFIVFLALAPSEIYRRDQKAIADAKSQIDLVGEQLKNRDEIIASRKPQLNAEIKAYYSLALTLGGLEKQHDGTYLALYIVVRNTGAPSVAVEWRGGVIVPSGEELRGMPISFPAGFEKKLTEKSHPRAKVAMYAFSRDRSIIRITNATIQNGEAPSGWMLLLLPGLTFDQLEGDGFTAFVEFEDVYGQRHRVLHPMKGSDLDDGPLPPEGSEIFMQGDLDTD